jgi:hypothetical protein
MSGIKILNTEIQTQRKIFLHLSVISTDPWGQEKITYSSLYTNFIVATIARWADMPGTFLGNGSVNTFPQQGTDAQQ